MDLEDKFYIRGKGTVITARLEEGELPPNPGSMIEYRGINYKVREIERFMKPLSIPIPSNSIGMIVTEVL